MTKDIFTSVGAPISIHSTGPKPSKAEFLGNLNENLPDDFIGAIVLYTVSEKNGRVDVGFLGGGPPPHLLTMVAYAHNVVMGMLEKTEGGREILKQIREDQ